MIPITRGVTRLKWLGLGFLLLASACATTKQDTFSDLTGKMMARGMGDIGEYYVTEPDMAALTLAGFQNLQEINKSLQAEFTADGRLSLKDDTTTLSIEAPGNKSHYSDWIELATELMINARKELPNLRGASSEDIYTAYFEGITGKLDTYSRYHSASASKEVRARREGFGGIGITIALENNKPVVKMVRDGSPASIKGVKVGDVILNIDGENVEDMDLRMVVNLLRGPIDSEVTVFFQGEKELPRELIFRRVYFSPESVLYRRENDVAYFRIFSFSRNTSENLMERMMAAQEEIGKKKIRGYILDLRGNPGGLVDQSVAMANIFLEEGQIVSTLGRHPDSKQSFEATDNDLAKKKPVIVLVNGATASAAEIVSAALQDNGRAVLIGTNSFGKGTVQAIERMPNGGELDLTWARYHAPSGYFLHDLGVLPNICTADSKSADGILADLRNKKIPAVPVKRRNSVSPTDTTELTKLRDLCPARDEDADIDMELALKLLNDPTLVPQALHLAWPPKPTS